MNLKEQVLTTLMLVTSLSSADTGYWAKMHADCTNAAVVGVVHLSALVDSRIPKFDEFQGVGSCWVDEKFVFIEIKYRSSQRYTGVGVQINPKSGEILGITPPGFCPPKEVRSIFCQPIEQLVPEYPGDPDK